MYNIDWCITEKSMLKCDYYIVRVDKSRFEGIFNNGK